MPSRESPFTDEQEKWIIMKYSKLQSATLVRRKFRLQFKINPTDVPRDSAFTRVFSIFNETGSVQIKKPTGRSASKVTEGSIATVKELVDINANVSTTLISRHLDMSHMTAWKIMKADLGMHPYKPKKTQPLTQQHKDMRLAFCD